MQVAQVGKRMSSRQIYQSVIMNIRCRGGVINCVVVMVGKERWLGELWRFLGYALLCWSYCVTVKLIKY